MNADELRERFSAELFSPLAKIDLAKAIHESYLILCRCAVDASVPNVEDVAAVLEDLSAKKPAAPEKACMVWEWVRIPDSYTKSKLSTPRLINDLGRSIDVRRIKDFQGDERRLLNTFFEMRACCQMVRIIRNRNAHIDEYSNQPNQIFHEAYTLVRVYELHSELVGYSRNGLIQAGALSIDDESSIDRKSSALEFIAPRVPAAVPTSQPTKRSGKSVISVKGGRVQASGRITLDSLTEIAEQERERLEAAIQRIVVDALDAVDFPTFDSLEEKLEKVLERAETRASGDDGDVSLDRPSLINVAEAENQLIELRNRIRDELKQEDMSFEGYNNILQRPVIFSALKVRCVSFDEFKNIPRLRSMMERNGWRFYEEQVNRFGDAIDSIFRRIDYSAKSSDEDVGDDIPF
ncbi:hypothetical protein [Halomonas sp. H5]|uniref:hypothetical protein n=1 Tax=Halomonas sp. H5 TaxID=3423910 RepID=UPI003D36766D